MKNDTGDQDTSFLSDLVLLRNDPDIIKKILPLAHAGNSHAQYALGLIYTEGRGIKPDNVQAYVWLSRSIMQGDNDAYILRNIIISEMNKEEINFAESVLKIAASPDLVSGPAQ